MSGMIGIQRAILCEIRLYEPEGEKSKTRAAGIMIDITVFAFGKYRMRGTN